MDQGSLERETMKENNSIKDEAIMTMQSKGKTVEFEGESIMLEGNILNKAWKQAWKVVKSCFKKGTGEKKERERKTTIRKKCKVKFIKARPEAQHIA